MNFMLILYAIPPKKYISFQNLRDACIHQHIPFLFQKDKKLIEIANETKVAFVGLSFVRHAEDVNQALNLLNDNIEIITKVETKSAVKHLNSILDIAPYILIDRGLSTEVSLEKVLAFKITLFKSVIS